MVARLLDEAKKSKLQSTQKLRSNSASTYFGEKFVEIMKKNNLANKNYSSLTFKWDSFFTFKWDQFGGGEGEQ